MPENHDDHDDGPPGWMNLAAFVFLALLVAGGVWLVNRMYDQSKLEDCMMAGRRNCAGPFTR